MGIVRILAVSLFGYLAYTYLVKPFFSTEKKQKKAPKPSVNVEGKEEESIIKDGEYIDYEEVDNS